MPVFLADALFGAMMGISTGIWIGMLINERRYTKLKKENYDN